MTTRARPLIAGTQPLRADDVLVGPDVDGGRILCPGSYKLRESRLQLYFRADAEQILESGASVLV